MRIPSDEGVLGDGIGAVRNLSSPELRLFSSHAVFLLRGRDQTQRLSCSWWVPRLGGVPTAAPTEEVLGKLTQEPVQVICRGDGEGGQTE